MTQLLSEEYGGGKQGGRRRVDPHYFYDEVIEGRAFSR
jgi:hypothetical protein